MILNKLNVWNIYIYFWFLALWAEIKMSLKITDVALLVINNHLAHFWIFIINKFVSQYKYDMDLRIPRGGVVLWGADSTRMVKIEISRLL